MANPSARADKVLTSSYLLLWTAVAWDDTKVLHVQLPIGSVVPVGIQLLLAIRRLYYTAACPIITWRSAMQCWNVAVMYMLCAVYQLRHVLCTLHTILLV